MSLDKERLLLLFFNNAPSVNMMIKKKCDKTKRNVENWVVLQRNVKNKHKDNLQFLVLYKALHNIFI